MNEKERRRGRERLQIGRSAKIKVAKNYYRHRWALRLPKKQQ